MIYTQENRAVSFIIGIIATLFFSSILAIFIIIIQGKQFTSDQGIVQTGVIRLNTVPNDVDVLVNDKPASKNGNVIANLALGINKITLSKIGYSLWEKDIDVKPDKVNDIFVQLFPDELNLEQFTSLNIDRIYLNNDLSKAIFTVTNSEIEREIGLWNLSLNRSIINISGENKPEKISFFTPEFLNLLKNNDYNIHNSNEHIAFEVFVEEKTEYYIQTTGTEIINVRELLGAQIDSLILKDNFIIAKKDGLIFSYSIQNKSKTIIALVDRDKSVDYCISENRIFFGNVDENIIGFTNISGNGMGEFATLAPIKKLICSENNNYINYISNESDLKFIKFDGGFEYQIASTSNIISTSRLGDRFILDSADGVERSIMKITNLNEIGNTVKPEIKKSEVSKDGKVYFTDSGNNIVSEISIVDESNPVLNNSYIISDSDGMNPKNILENEVIGGNSILRLAQDGRYLFIVLDSSLIKGDLSLEEGQSPTPNFNLYRIGLVE